MKSRLDAFYKAGMFSHLDFQLALNLGGLAPQEPESVLLAAAFVSRGVELGHVCIDLKNWKELLVFQDRDTRPNLPSPPEHGAWIRDLKASLLVSDGRTYSPLVLDEKDRLYLRRYWSFQQEFANGIVRRMNRPPCAVPEGILQKQLNLLFPIDDGDLHCPYLRQRIAAERVARQDFSVISGGPGTGKTTTVLNILVLLQEIARASGRSPLRCDLLAPTGKAAARLSETIRQRRESLEVDSIIKASIPGEASTIHRRLGLNPEKPGHVRHHRDNPLRTDVVFLDEASMVDLSLMTKLEKAVPPNAKFILLGDPDQLASVEVGAVFGDVCRTFAEIDASPPDAHRLTPSDNERKEFIATQTEASRPKTLITLTHHFRFSQTSAIGTLASAIKNGEKDRASKLFAFSKSNAPTDQSIATLRLHEQTRLKPVLRRHIVEGFLPYLQAGSPTERMEKFDSFRILCAFRRGPYGALAVNHIVESVLAEEGLINPTDLFYIGRPIMVTRNDYQLQLFNGDVGLIMADEMGHPRVFFPTENGGLRTINPSHLPQHETAYGLTIHKSQGSEFERVLLLLSPQDSKILTRELIYTGVTRVRSQLILASCEEALRAALDRRIRRPSGIREVLVRNIVEGDPD